MTAEELFASHVWLAKSIAALYGYRLRGTRIMYADLQQEAYMGLWQAVTRCVDETGFSGFARMRIRGAIQDFLRDLSGGRKKGDRPTLEEYVESYAPCDRRPSPEALAITSQQAVLVKAAVIEASLSARQAFAVERYYQRGETARVIGAALGIDEHTAWNTLRRAQIKIGRAYAVISSTPGLNARPEAA